jgi:hypothetical protein
MDGVFLLIGYILTTVIKRFYSMTGKSAADTLSKFSDIFWTVATAGIVVSPWFIYNIVYLGKIFPVSGSATRAINIAWSGGIFPAVWAVFKNIAADVSLYVFAVGQTDTVIVFAPIVLVAMIYIGIYMIGSNPNVLIDFAFLITSAVLYFCYYLFYQLAWRKWYPMFMFYILTIILVISLGKMMLEEYKIKNPVSEHRLTTLLIVGVFVLSSFGGFYIHHQTGESNYYNSWKNTADHINSNYSEDDRFIASGSGILQYYTSNSDIYEWRGVVNSNIYQARNDGEIKGFVRSKNISYIIDYEDTTVGDHIYNNELAGFDVNKISCHPAKRTNKTFCIYRIRSV